MTLVRVTTHGSDFDRAVRDEKRVATNHFGLQSRIELSRLTALVLGTARYAGSELCLNCDAFPTENVSESMLETATTGIPGNHRRNDLAMDTGTWNGKKLLIWDGSRSIPSTIYDAESQVLEGMRCRMETALSEWWAAAAPQQRHQVSVFE